jgi:hypothetical protein
MIEPLFDEDGRLSRTTLDELELVLVANPPILERFIDALEEIAVDARREGRW